MKAAGNNKYDRDFHERCKNAREYVNGSYIKEFGPYQNDQVTNGRWMRRYIEEGIDGLKNRKPGRKPGSSQKKP
jgi:hypothetical protein